MPFSIIVDSDNQLSSISKSNSDFSVKLQTNFYILKSSFKKIIIPFAWYPIDSTNNSLTVTDGGGTSAVVLTQPSTWSGNGIATMLQTALNADATLSATYTVTYNASTAKFTIAANGNFTLKFATSNNTLYKILGFLNVDTYTGAATYTGDNVSYISGFPYIIIKSRALTSQARNKSTCFQGTTTNVSVDTLLTDSKPVYLKVPVNAGFGEMIIWTEGDFERVIEYTRDSDGRPNQLFQILDFQVVNPWTDVPINMNGADWSIEFECESRDN